MVFQNLKKYPIANFFFGDSYILGETVEVLSDTIFATTHADIAQNQWTEPQHNGHMSLMK